MEQISHEQLIVAFLVCPGTVSHWFLSFFDCLRNHKGLPQVLPRCSRRRDFFCRSIEHAELGIPHSSSFHSRARSITLKLADVQTHLSARLGVKPSDSPHFELAEVHRLIKSCSLRLRLRVNCALVLIHCAKPPRTIVRFPQKESISEWTGEDHFVNLLVFVGAQRSADDRVQFRLHFAWGIVVSEIGLPQRGRRFLRKVCESIGDGGELNAELGLDGVQRLGLLLFRVFDFTDCFDFFLKLFTYFLHKQRLYKMEQSTMALFYST